MGFFSRVFRAFERKASQFGALAVRVFLGRAAWPERDAAKLAREGYQQNVVAHSCIRMIAQAAASVPWCLYDGDKEIEEHELLDLLNQPNPLQDGAEFLEAFYSFLLIAGTTYAEQVTGLGNKPLELYALRPDRMRLVPGPEGWPAAYQYSANGQTRTVAVDIDKAERPIMQMRLFHPLNDFYGMSPLDPAGYAVDTHNGAGAFNNALLENSAVPSGALIVKEDKEGDATLSGDQYEQIDKELTARFTGKRNSGRPMILSGGLDWKSFSMSLADMQFSETKRDSARDIALAFGTPPMLLGIPGDNTYANYKEANLAFWRQTVIPLVQKAARSFSNWLNVSYGGKLKFVPDLDNLDALAEERQQQWDRISNSKELTVNEKRQAKGYDTVPGGDVILVSATEIPLESVGADITGTSGNDTQSGG